jgi:hypothetical protein
MVLGRKFPNLEMCSQARGAELDVWVGRPGLDPGTLGLKVLVKSLRRLASCRTLS